MWVVQIDIFLVQTPDLKCNFFLNTIFLFGNLTTTNLSLFCFICIK